VAAEAAPRRAQSAPARTVRSQTLSLGLTDLARRVVMDPDARSSSRSRLASSALLLAVDDRACQRGSTKPTAHRQQFCGGVAKELAWRFGAGETDLRSNRFRGRAVGCGRSPPCRARFSRGAPCKRACSSTPTPAQVREPAPAAAQAPQPRPPGASSPAPSSSAPASQARRARREVPAPPASRALATRASRRPPPVAPVGGRARREGQPPWTRVLGRR
jgi:hypothetical protein